MAALVAALGTAATTAAAMAVMVAGAGQCM